MTLSRAVAVGVLVAATWPLARAVQAQRLHSAVDSAINFYLDGGSYCVRIAPEGVALAQETEWTVIVLTSRSNRATSFKIRTADPGKGRLSGPALADARAAIDVVWKFEGERELFFERFAEGIRAGMLRARVVKAGPGNLAKLASDRERAEAYLKFSERGSTVSFDKVPDLTAEEFARYATYITD